MDLFEAIFKRHSFRGTFLDKLVCRNNLIKIVETALAAPSACNAQSPKFIILDDPALLEQIKALFQSPVVQTAKAFILCIADERPVYRNISFWAEDCAAAVENMLLAITALGYATVWLDGILRDGLGENIARLVSLPKHLRVQILLPIGIPSTEESQPKKLPFEKRVFFNRYQKNE